MLVFQDAEMGQTFDVRSRVRYSLFVSLYVHFLITSNLFATPTLQAVMVMVALDPLNARACTAVFHFSLCRIFSARTSCFTPSSPGQIPFGHPCAVLGIILRQLPDVCSRLFLKRQCSLANS